jgi:multicomponent K+:H+ antiporter subunit A
VWHLGLPVLGEIHVASAMFFDVGVFLVVVGATMLALANLSRVSRRAENLPTNVAPMDVDPSQAVAVKEG